MATTQAQRASLFNTLAELMGTDDAETLMEQLPPSGWDNVATKDDLKVLTATFTAALADMRAGFTDALAGIAGELADTRAGFTKALAGIVSELADTRAGFTDALAETNAAMQAGFTDALAGIAGELADTRAGFTDALAETNAAMQAGFAKAATERADLVKSQAEIIKSHARHVYVTVSTIVLATVSIWIALLAGPAGG